ncbi:sugar phosphate isomerase/epimerase family protein [Acidicapsa dinghuensis]|uniref:Sugar phosphate isomerase/epimerase family protein n=1 Tax=Acidicapsa dinghuensis TaxID=2218256 RepID=A0ABW1EEW4_9BACT|nr:sugar phosphate isomerase/epimerase [Acidicapsa dinghuensis]
MSTLSRRTFLQTSSAAAIAAALPQILHAATVTSCEFKLAVITDEISPDFDHACSVIANDFGMRHAELRTMWSKNITSMGDDDLARAEATLRKYKLQVTDIASPLFKTDFPGAPISKSSPRTDTHGASADLKEQDELLEKSIALAKRFKTDRIRCFDFWRLDDPTPYRAAVNAKLLEAANRVGKEHLILVLENEFECNTATGREAAQTLAAVQSPWLQLNWDPGNAVARGELDAFPAGWDLLPKDRIGHCHVKCAIAEPDTKAGFEWAPVGKGSPDWVGQFKALKKIKYRHAVSLETHWRGGGSPEASTRISWTGMHEALVKAGAAAPSPVPGTWPQVDITG